MHFPENKPVGKPSIDKFIKLDGIHLYQFLMHKDLIQHLIKQVGRLI